MISIRFLAVVSLNQKNPCIKHIHGRIIKWTQYIGFLTLAEIAQVIEGNHGNDSKEGSKNSVFIAVWRNLIMYYI